MLLRCSLSTWAWSRWRRHLLPRPTTRRKSARPWSTLYDIVALDLRVASVARPTPSATSVTPAKTRTSTRVCYLAVGFAAARYCAGRAPAACMSTRHRERRPRLRRLVRAALAREKLNLLGYSYGTFPGATYAGLFPERVGRHPRRSPRPHAQRQRGLGLQMRGSTPRSSTDLRLRHPVHLPGRGRNLDEGDPDQCSFPPTPSRKTRCTIHPNRPLTENLAVTAEAAHENEPRLAVPSCHGRRS